MGTPPRYYKHTLNGKPPQEVHRIVRQRPTPQALVEDPFVNNNEAVPQVGTNGKRSATRPKASPHHDRNPYGQIWLSNNTTHETKEISKEDVAVKLDLLC